MNFQEHSVWELELPPTKSKDYCSGEPNSVPGAILSNFAKSKNASYAILDRYIAPFFCIMHRGINVGV